MHEVPWRGDLEGLDRLDVGRQRDDERNALGQLVVDVRQPISQETPDIVRGAGCPPRRVEALEGLFVTLLGATVAGARCGALTDQRVGGARRRRRERAHAFKPDEAGKALVQRAAGSVERGANRVLAKQAPSANRQPKLRRGGDGEQLRQTRLRDRSL